MQVIKYLIITQIMQTRGLQPEPNFRVRVGLRKKSICRVRVGFKISVNLSGFVGFNCYYQPNI